MKIELNTENRLKFYAQYFEQRVVCFDEDDIKNPFNLNVHSIPNFYHDDFKGFLLLKSLKNICDEDAFEIVEILKSIGMISAAMIDAQSFLMSFKEEKNNTINKISPVVDFLRSKGYAVDWMGLTVQEMIDAGWIKLIE